MELIFTLDLDTGCVRCHVDPYQSMEALSPRVEELTGSHMAYGVQQDGRSHGA
jgi:hypothetical protein